MLENAPEVVSEVDRIPLLEKANQINRVTFYQSVGTAFDARSQFNVTIGELLADKPVFNFQNKQI